MPEPYRRLLVHERDMTPTLEAAYGRRLRLRVLQHAASGDVFSRLVVLTSGSDELAVEMGAIRIFLKGLPPAAREAVFRQRNPFGAVLHKNGVPHCSRPVAYFEVTADSMIADALRLDGSRELYGRRNTIWSSSGEELAEVVEILRP
jgi:hypothetical protein